MGRETRSDGARGRAPARSGPLDRLRSILPRAPSELLDAALDNPRIGEGEVLLILRNRRASPELLQRVASHARWIRHYEIKRALVLHPHTPLPLGRRLAGQLYRRELEEVANAVQVNPVVRRLAEELLHARLQEMTLGEKVTLARGASRGVIRGLVRSVETRVLIALLSNPRLMELDAVAVARGATAPPDALRGLAEHPRWGLPRAVRKALLENPRTPVPVALGLLRSLAPRDLQRLVRDPRTPRIVRIGALRRLQPGGPGRSRSSRLGEDRA